MGRRSSEEQVERSIHEHFGDIARDILETTKIRGLVLRDRTRKDKVNMKQHNSRCRLSANYWKELVREVSQDVEVVTWLEPDDPKWTVSETLVEALINATSTNMSIRSTEALQTFLQNCGELNEGELIGLCKNGQWTDHTSEVERGWDFV